MSTKAAQSWAELNERQRLYLSVIYDADQAAEDDIKSGSERWQKTPPASQWRQITYDIKAPKNAQLGAGYTSIQHTLRQRGEHDPGSGSTLVVLEKRQLINGDPRPGTGAVAGLGTAHPGSGCPRWGARPPASAQVARLRPACRAG